MDKGDRIWGGDWRAKLLSHLQQAGFDTVTDFLAQFPAEPYVELAERLGADVAALQLEWMQFEEARCRGGIRFAAMDSLPRELRYHLPGGWRGGTKGDFDTSGAYADWVVRLGQQAPDVEPKAKAVWAALEELRPPLGWLPTGPNDSFIVDAFLRGWPEE